MFADDDFSSMAISLLLSNSSSIPPLQKYGKLEKYILGYPNSAMTFILLAKLLIPGIRDADDFSRASNIKPDEERLEQKHPSINCLFICNALVLM